MMEVDEKVVEKLLREMGVADSYRLWYRQEQDKVADAMQEIERLKGLNTELEAKLAELRKVCAERGCDFEGIHLDTASTLTFIDSWTPPTQDDMPDLRNLV